MGMCIDESEVNDILKKEFQNIFRNTDFASLTNFKRRKFVFDYLVKNSEYDFSLLNNIYSGKRRMYADEIASVLEPDTQKKGVCNSFSYAYKMLLDKLNIPCMLVSCMVEEESLKNFEEQGVNTKTSMIETTDEGTYLVSHMLVLVQNDNGTFSFDDITYAIFNKGNEESTNFFDYNYQMAR